MNKIKCVNIKQDTHKRLMLFKISQGYTSIDKTITALLDYKESSEVYKNGR